MSRAGVRSPGARASMPSPATQRAPAPEPGAQGPALDSDGRPVRARPTQPQHVTSAPQAMDTSSTTLAPPQVLIDAGAFAALACEVHRRVDAVERRLDRTLRDDGAALRVWLQMAVDAQSQRIRAVERGLGALVERVEALEGRPSTNGRRSAKAREGSRVRLPETARLARRALLGGSPEEPKGDEAEWSDDDGDFEYVGQPIARCFDGRLVLGKVTGFLRQLEGPVLWHAAHDDGDSEDLEHDEVVQGLRAFAEHAAETSRKAQRDRFVSALHGTGPLASQVPEQLGSDGEGAQQAWASSTRSRVVLLERLRSHTSRHEGSVVATSFFFELPVDTERYGDYEARVSSPPICLRDIGDKLYAGRYRTPESVDSDLRRVFQNCRDYNPEGSVVREFGDALSRVMEQWVADYNACAELVGETLLCADARPYASLVASGCSRCRQRGCPDCMRGLPDLCVARPCAETGASLHVCAFLPTAGLAGVCAAARRASDLGGPDSAAARAAAPFSGPPTPPLLAPARPGKKRARVADAAAANGENGHRRPKRAFSADL